MYECNVLHSPFSLHSLFLFIHIDIVLSLWMILMDSSWILQTQILFPNHCLHLSWFRFKQHWWILWAHASVSQITIISSTFWIIYVSWIGRMLFRPYKLQFWSLLFIHKMLVFNNQYYTAIYIYIFLTCSVSQYIFYVFILINVADSLGLCLSHTKSPLWFASSTLYKSFGGLLSCRPNFKPISNHLQILLYGILDIAWAKRVS